MYDLRNFRQEIVIAIGSSLSFFICIIIFSTPIMGMFAIGPIVSPGGVFGSAYGSRYTSGTLFVGGITDEVTVIRDIWGVPHIYGKTHEDVAFALGYMHAYDRLFQMDIVTRTGMGLMSEILGEDALEDDLFYQTIGIEKAAQEMIDIYEIERATNSELDRFLNILDSYTLGVNTMITKRIQSKTLPIEFSLLGFEPTPWTPLKTFVYNRLMSLMLSFSNLDVQATILRDELFQGNETRMNEVYPVNNTYYQIPVIPDYGNYSESVSTIEQTYNYPDSFFSSKSEDLLEILDFIPESVKYFQNSWIGSNNWVVNGSLTSTGAPILCNDMHLSITLPHIWYEAHLVAKDDDINVYGYTLTGTPVVIVGYNTYVAWGFTNVGNDAVDWYEYKWNTDGQYWSGIENKWKDLTEREITIPIRGKRDFNTIIQSTEDGVIMGDTKGKTKLAMRWTATEFPTYEILALSGANQARNWEDFNNSMQYFKDPPQNIIFADSSGKIALRPTGRFIKRTSFGEGYFIQNGSDPLVDKTWEYIPYNELPLSVNPAQMYLASANQKSTGPEYQYYISSAQAPGYRGRAINKILSEASLGSIDVAFMQDAQCGRGGIYDTAAEAFTPYFVSAVSSEQLTSLETEALTELITWQDSTDKFLMNKTLIGPTIYAQILERFREFVWQDHFTAAQISGVSKPQDNVLEYYVKTQPASYWFDDISTEGVSESRDDIIIKAFKQAINDLEGDFGLDIESWTYGAYHRMYFNHLSGISAFAANNEGFPHDGSGYTLLAAGGRKVRGGPSERMIIGFANISNCLSVIPGGASGNPANVHYKDQALELWLQAEYHPMLIQYTNENVFPEEYREVTLIFKPK